MNEQNNAGAMKDDKPRAETQAPEFPKIPWWKKIIFSLVPLFCLLLAGEVLFRICRGKLFSLENKRVNAVDIFHTPRPASFDPHLGWVLAPGAQRSAAKMEGGAVCVTPEGFRSNGETPPPGTPLLAVGDSFTFGYEVGDGDTWPAKLERLLKRPVHNGGVFGYGFDQVVLRAELLCAHTSYPLVLVSVIDDDIDRCAMSYRNAWKPYFEISGEDLLLKNDPVPQTALPRPPALKALLGYSVLADFVFDHSHAGRQWWDDGVMFVIVHGRGMDVAKRLTGRLAALQRAGGPRVLLLVQGTRSGGSPRLTQLLESGRAAGLETLDLAAPLEELLRAAPQKRAELFSSHMTPAGNAWVAEKIAEKIKSLKPQIDADK